MNELPQSVSIQALKRPYSRSDSRSSVVIYDAKRDQKSWSAPPSHKMDIPYGEEREDLSPLPYTHFPLFQSALSCAVHGLPCPPLHGVH